MMTQETEKVRKQMQIVCIDDLVPKDHLLRLIDMALDWTFIYDLVPHFSTFGKNYTRRCKDTDLFEQIFQHVLEECYRFKLVDPTEILLMQHM